MFFLKPRLESLHKTRVKDSLPLSYPIPKKYSDLLFYLQRNHNTNTILYEVNRLPDGFINRKDPLKIYIKRYDDTGNLVELDYLQRTLVYGYGFNEINSSTFEISFVARPELKFFLVDKENNNQYRLLLKVEESLININNIYAYADNNGVFPTLKSLEIFGHCSKTGTKKYTKLSF